MLVVTNYSLVGGIEVTAESPLSRRRMSLPKAELEAHSDSGLLGTQPERCVITSCGKKKGELASTIKYVLLITEISLH